MTSVVNVTEIGIFPNKHFQGDHKTDKYIYGHPGSTHAVICIQHFFYLQDQFINQGPPSSKGKYVIFSKKWLGFQPFSMLKMTGFDVRKYLVNRPELPSQSDDLSCITAYPYTFITVVE